MNCIQCAKEHDRKGMYCSKNCTDKAYRHRKAIKEGKIIKPKHIKSSVIIPKESGPKLKWCNFCGSSIENSSMLRFCNEDHQVDYYETVSIGGTLKLRLDARTLIETKKYDRVQELIEAMRARNGSLNFF